MDIVAVESSGTPSESDDQMKNGLFFVHMINFVAFNMHRCIGRFVVVVVVVANAAAVVSH